MCCKLLVARYSSGNVRDDRSEKDHILKLLITSLYFLNQYFRDYAAHTLAAVRTVPTSPGAISHPHNPTALPRTHTRGNLPTLLCSRGQQCPKQSVAVAVSEIRLCL